MSALVLCGACQMGEHDRHDGEHHGLPGLLGGHQCGCAGDCKPPPVFELLTRAGLTADEAVALEAAKWVANAEAERDRHAARASRAMGRLARVTTAMVEEYGSFEGHDVWCPKSVHYEMVSDHPRGDRPCDCFAGALRAALADQANRPADEAGDDRG